MEAKKKLERILIVEDDADHRALIETSLMLWSEVNRVVIELASTAAEALEKISSTHFDLILTDYKLPDKTGLDILAEVKGKNMGIPVLLMTAMGDQALAVSAL